MNNESLALFYQSLQFVYWGIQLGWFERSYNWVCGNGWYDDFEDYGEDADYISKEWPKPTPVY